MVRFELGVAMGLADALANEMPGGSIKPCRVAELRDGMTKPDREALDAAVGMVRDARANGMHPHATTGLSAAAIRRALLAEGYTVSIDSLQDHVYRRCGCE